MGALVGAGLSLGRSSTLGFNTRYFERFRNVLDRRDFITCGVACGVAAAFGAPIGGLLFALEEVASFWSVKLTWQIFFGCGVAVFVTDILNSSFTNYKQVAPFGSFQYVPTCAPRLADTAPALPTCALPPRHPPRWAQGSATPCHTARRGVARRGAARRGVLTLLPLPPPCLQVRGDGLLPRYARNHPSTPLRAVARRASDQQQMEGGVGWGGCVAHRVLGPGVWWGLLAAGCVSPVPSCRAHPAPFGNWGRGRKARGENNSTRPQTPCSLLRGCPLRLCLGGVACTWLFTMGTVSAAAFSRCEVGFVGLVFAGTPWCRT